MIYISYPFLIAFISILWVLVRIHFFTKAKSFSWKREAQLMLVYICIVVVVRFTFFPFGKMDGKIQPHNLRTSAQDEKWLLARLAARGYAPESICLAWLDTHGIMTVQTMDGTTLSFPALDPGKVGW